MRYVARFLASAALAIFVGACNLIAEGQYYREGIGSELYRPELPDVTALQNQYIEFICRQADLSVEPAGCALPSSSRNWALFVQAGMNDIDLRCDSFLNWVDYHRRNDRHLMKQIGDTIQATTDILNNTTTSQKSIEIVSLALGLAKNTFANSTARLLTTADQTTIQSVVLTNQKRYRVWLKNEIIDNRPAAIHALRSYLRICMPAMIETEINTSATLVQRGGSAAIAAIERDPLINPITIPSRRADRPIEVTPPPRTPLGTALTATERSIGLEQAKAIQRVLCVDGTGDFGPEGSPTRKALIDFKSALALPKVGRIEDSAQLAALTTAVTTVRSCAEQMLANAYEVGIFSRFGATSVRARIRRAIDSVNRRAAENEKITIPTELTNPPSNATMGETIRVAVTSLRRFYSTKQLGITAGNTIDQSVWQQITNDGLVQ